MKKKKSFVNPYDEAVCVWMDLPDDKKVCARCGKTKAQRELEPAMPTGSANFNYAYTRSFSIGVTGTYPDLVARATCPECHKEESLEGLFALMDARDNLVKEAKKAKRGRAA